MEMSDEKYVEYLEKMISKFEPFVQRIIAHTNEYRKPAGGFFSENDTNHQEFTESEWKDLRRLADEVRS